MKEAMAQFKKNVSTTAQVKDNNENSSKEA